MRREAPRRTGAAGDGSMPAWDTGRGTARSDREPPCSCPCRQWHVSALPECRRAGDGVKETPGAFGADGERDLRVCELRRVAVSC